MPKIILSANVNILDLLVGNLEFSSGLNILSGENGTLKTRLLQQLKNEPARLVVSEGPAGPLRVQAVKSETECRATAFSTIFADFRQKNQKLDALINKRSINDQTFDNYPSLGDLFYVVYDDLCKDGGDQQAKMTEATEQFNGVIGKLFSNYELVSEWNPSAGSPNIKMIKNGDRDVQLEGLSLGEQEMLSLVVNLYTSKNRYDIFIIDEPEVHLNWHLEEKLFDYLDDFCRDYEKQMILVTHSRAIFKKKFLEKSQFLYWGEDGKVQVGKQLTPDQQKKLTGDAIEIIAMGDLAKPTFFLEDGRHKEVVESLARELGVDVSISQCGNSSNVRSLFRHSKREGGWLNSYFITDGDNEGNPFPGEKTFIHLDKYSIENFLLNLELHRKAKW